MLHEAAHSLPPGIPSMHASLGAGQPARLLVPGAGLLAGVGHLGVITCAGRTGGMRQGQPGESGLLLVHAWLTNRRTFRCMGGGSLSLRRGWCAHVGV